MRPASEAPWTLFWPRSGCSPVPGRPTCPVTSAIAIRQRALSVPWTCWEIPMPQKMIEAREVAYVRAIDRIVFRLHAANRLHRLRRESQDALGKVREALGEAVDILLVSQVLGDDGVQHRVQQ